MINKTTLFNSSRAHLDASTVIYKAIFLIFVIFHFEHCLGDEFNQNKIDGIEEIKAGMNKIVTGFPENGVFLIRNGRFLLFNHRNDPLVDALLQESILEEARGELFLAEKKEGLKREIHLEAATELLGEVERNHPTLESHLLFAKLLEKRGETEVALQKIDLWLQKAKTPFERGKLLFAKGELLNEREEILEEALLALEKGNWEGEETLKLRLILAKKREEKGENLEALRFLSKVVNTVHSSPLVEEALALRGELLGKIGRRDLQARHQER